MNDLFSDFPPATYLEWQQLLNKNLKSGSLENLNWQVDNHLILKPLYSENQSNTEPIYWNHQNNWEITERFHWDGNYKEAKKIEFMQSLQGGIQTAEIHLNLAAVADLEYYLQGVWLEMLTINWIFDEEKTVELWFAQLQKLELTPQIKGFIFVYSSTIAQQFSLYDSWKLQIPNANFFICTEQLNQNLSIAENLAQLLLQIYEIYQLVGDLQVVAKNLRIDFFINQHFLVEIAKIRAFKKLWLAFLQSLEAAENPFFPKIQAETLSCFSQNENYNQIVASSQSLSAAIARVDFLLVCPATGWAKADEKSRRLARNVQHILIEESHLNANFDPAAGSFYIENVGQQLLENAWKLFENTIKSR